MATVTDGTTTDIVAAAASTIAQLDQKVAAVVSDVEAAKAKVVSALQTHVAQHQAQMAAHAAEVNAAQKIIATASPNTTVKADQAAAFVLTSSSQVQGVVNFLGRNWRYVVGVLAIGVIAYGKFVLHI